MKRNKRLLHYVLCMMAALLLSAGVYAQQTVRGTLRGSGGEPLAGATVTVKGTTRSVVTDTSGRFTIDVPPGSTLVVSSVGYQTREITAREGELNETLQTTEGNLNEVVVIGYQTVRRRDVTGSVSIINPAQANRNVASSVAEAIQGLAAGVTVRNSGAPGAGAKIDIRGAGTFAGNNPLYIIDGMYSDATPDFNPNDIQSIQILKDASEAAIYGSRAANGVVIITTKRGREGPLVINGSVKTGVQGLHKRWDMMESQEYINQARLLYTNAGQVVPSGIANPDLSINTDWQEELFRTGNIQDYNLAFSGGSRTANYFLSGSYFNNTGPVIDNRFQRASLRLNTAGQRGRFRIGQNMLLSYTQDDFIASDIFTNPFVDIITMLPILKVQDPARYARPVTNPEGWAIGDESAPTLAANVIALQNMQQNDQYNFKIRGNAFAEFSILDWLTYKFNLGAETSFDRFKGFRRPGTIRRNTPAPLATADENRANFLSFLFEHTLNFDRTFGVHKINGVVGISNQTLRREILSGQKSDLPINSGPTDFFTGLNQGSAPATTSYTDKWANLGFLGRLNYSLYDRYQLSLTFRRDGDSRFGRDYRWGNFPSVSAAWRIGRESFFNVPAVSELKLRGSYGALGNSEFLRPWQYSGRINPFPRAVFGASEVEQLGAINTQLANADLRWETKKTANIGLDAGFLQNRVFVTADYFIARTEDVLTSIPLPLSLGNAGGDPPVNAASLENRGFELSLTYRAPGSGDFRWDAMLNVTSIRNRVTDLGNIGSKTYIQSGDARTQIGRAIGEWYVLKTNGLFQNQREIDEHKIQPWAKPGDIRYVDGNGDGKLDVDTDRVFAGSPWADLETGLVLNGSFRNFTLGMQWYAVFGNQLYNRPRYNIDRMDQNTNFRSGIQPWTVNNPNTDFPRVAISTNNDPGIGYNVLPFTDRWLESGSYVRLRNLELGYTLPQGFLQSVGFTNSRVYISGQNLLTFTKYTGLDPDITGVNIFERGLDNGQYPALRIISAGINLSF